MFTLRTWNPVPKKAHGKKRSHGFNWETGEETYFSTHDAAWDAMNDCLKQNKMCDIIRR